MVGVKVVFPNFPLSRGDEFVITPALFHTTVLRLLGGVCLLLAALFVFPYWLNSHAAAYGDAQPLKEKVGGGSQRGDRFLPNRRGLTSRHVAFFVAAIVALAVSFNLIVRLLTH